MLTKEFIFIKIQHCVKCILEKGRGRADDICNVKAGRVSSTAPPHSSTSGHTALIQRMEVKHSRILIISFNNIC